ncbi:hypothetical protein SAMN02910265_01175 [Ruminococcus flavefaciens]|uniref:Dockerin domain-containing protein n=1 Tax=Ruminococcus flavefaciens TaxID=1265 RepID=A0A1H6IX47_RUMFL|nr:hypothetical protein [Ruminococcus flavefaciens]SEH51646.1 hypothetical protein SAMN02910265_01175 [Ruminococcus flavefaciens]
MIVNNFISLAFAFILGASANSAAISENNTKNKEKIIKTETFNASYKNTSYSGTFEYLECTANVYNNNKIEIKVTHNPQRDFGGSHTYEFGKITYPTDTFYSKVNLSNSIFHNPENFSKKEIYEKENVGYEYKYFSSVYGMDNTGELFTITLIPTIYLNEPVTVNVFGHELYIPYEYDPYSDFINRLDADKNGRIDSVDASCILKIYAINSTGGNIETIGDLLDYKKGE